MNYPEVALKPGTMIRTRFDLRSDRNIGVTEATMLERRANAIGMVVCCVPGTCGDAYSVAHTGEGLCAAYWTDEIELYLDNEP